MRLLLRMNSRCWGLRGARDMFIKLASDVRPHSHWRERNSQRTSATPIAGIGCPKTCKWGCGLTIHIFLLPSMSIRRLADFPSSLALTSKPLSLNSAARSLSRCWRLPVVLAINAMSSANAPAFTLISPTITASSG